MNSVGFLIFDFLLVDFHNFIESLTLIGQYFLSTRIHDNRNNLKRNLSERSSYMVYGI